MVILAVTVVVVVAVAVQEHQVLGQQGLGPATEAMVFPLQLQVKTYIGLVAGVVDRGWPPLVLEVVDLVEVAGVLWEITLAQPWALAVAGL